MQLAVWIFLSLSLLFSSPVWARNNDEAFASAQKAYDKNNETALAASLRELQANNYILAPYASYWLMLLRLSQSSTESVLDFLDKYADYPLADRVSRAWLKTLVNPH